MNWHVSSLAVRDVILSLPLPCATEPAQQPYLTGVIDIVKCDAPKLGQQLLPPRCPAQRDHCLLQGAVLPLQQFLVRAPRLLRIRPCRRTRKKVAAFQRER